MKGMLMSGNRPPVCMLPPFSEALFLWVVAHLLR